VLKTSVTDYCNCLNVGGQQFRTDYSAISDLRAFFSCPMGVFTATLTHEARNEVIKMTGLRSGSMTDVAGNPDR